MRISFEIGADFRETQGKGASRRLRHAGKVPAILYGGNKEPRNLTLDHQNLMTLVDNEKFYSSIINLKVGDLKQAAIVKDLQMHPARNAIVHVDLQRVLEDEPIRLHIPVHFKNEAIAPGVKTQGGVVSHRVADVEVKCLPKDLPEFIEVDLSGLDTSHSLHVSGVKLPPGVSAVTHRTGDPVVATAVVPKAAAEAETEAAEGEAVAAPATEAKATEAKAEDKAKKDEKKK